MKTDNSAASVFFALVADCRIGTVMKMGLLTGILLGGTLLVLSVIVVLGIIYLRLETKTKIKAGTIKDYIKNEKRLDGAAMGIVHSREKGSVKVDVLKAGADSRFAELTITGKSTSFFLRNDRKIKV